MRKGILLAAALFLVPGITQAASLEELLVEKGVITKSEARASHHMGSSKVYWNDGTRLDFADQGFTVQINSMLQSRYEYTDHDEDGTGGDNTSSFEMHRARIYMQGTALHEEFSYRLEVDFANSDNFLFDGAPNAGSNLLDAWIAWHPCDNAMLRMGNQRTPVSRQYNTQPQNLQFADRSVASQFFDQGRQNGLYGAVMLMDDKLTVGAGIYNGQSDNEGANTPGQDTKHMGAVNVRFDAMGEMNEYEEGDVDNTEEAALNFGAAYSYSDATDADGSVLGFADDWTTNTASVDANFKLRGLSVHGEFFYQNLENDSNVLGPVDTDAVGFYTQVGYFVAPKKVEIAGRYALLDCDDGTVIGCGLYNTSANSKVQEASLTLNYYWWKHHLKGQVGYVFLNEDPQNGGLDDVNTHRWLFQLSSYF